MNTIHKSLMVALLYFAPFITLACSPCDPLSGITQTINGNNLDLTFVSNAGWPCVYTVQIELICETANFTGVATHSSAPLDLSGVPSPQTNQPYQLVSIDISNLCPGTTYKWRAWEDLCMIFTQEYTFTTPGSNNQSLTVTPAADTICAGESVQLNANANSTCASGYSFSWAGAGLNNSQIANPIATPSSTTTYTVTATAPCAQPQVQSVEIFVYQPTPVTATAVDDICTTSIGEATANPDPSGSPPYTYDWLGQGTTQTITNLPAGTYTVELTDGNDCVSSASVVVDDTPAVFQGSTTVVSCPGGSDGTAFAEMVPVLGTVVTYQWDDANNQTTQTATGLPAGTYNCTINSDIGCQGTVTVAVTEIPGMIGTITNQTDVTCNSSNDGMIDVNVTQGTPPYYYSWDNSSSTTDIANDLYVGPHVCTVTDDNGCVITIPGVLSEPPPLDIPFITPDTQICPEHDILLQSTGTGGSSPYTFTWYEEGEFIGNGSDITVDPEETNTEYCVVLSEACGSPEDTACVLIYFPTPIEPNAIPDEPEKCVPDYFEFFNTSTNPTEIATTFWEFDANPTHVALENGDDSTSHYYGFDKIGSHDIIMTITSIYGCVYTDTLFDLITVLPKPDADFGFSTNPTTIFETQGIHIHDKSSPNVVQWEYDSPHSIPSSSSFPNPILDFPFEVPGEYPITLIVTTQHGCKDTTTLFMNVIHGINFYAPNAFTPDDDEFNQHWKPHISGIDIYDFELFVYNRWGQVIWENHDPSVGWDGTYNGKLVETGTYSWKAIVKDPYEDDRSTFTGFVTILK